MLAADTSSLVAYFDGAGTENADIALIEQALVEERLVLPPVVLTEFLSGVRGATRDKLSVFPLMALLPGYWERAGITRRTLLKRGLSAKIPEALIAQSCIDHGVALITRDEGFRHFAMHCGLKLA